VRVTEVGAPMPGPEAWCTADTAVSYAETASPPSEYSLRWDDDAAGPGLPGLSLSEHGRYLARVTHGASLSTGSALTTLRLGSDTQSALWLVTGHGRAGWTSLTLGSQETTVAVRPRWLDAPRAWRAMLDDLAAVGLAGCLEGAGAEVPVGVVAGEEAPTPEAVWLGLQEALRPGRLDAALAAIARDPRGSLGRGVRVVPWQRAARARSEDVAAAQAAGSRAAGVAEPVLQSRLDSPEHRFARFALDDMARAARALHDAPGMDTAAVHRAETALATLRRGLPSVEAVRPARNGRVTLGLVRHPGYSALWALWQMVRHALPVLSWGSAEASRVALRDTAALYERWCAVTLARALGVSPRGCVTLLREGSVPCLGATLWSQRTFAAGASWSLGWRPDLALACAGRWLLLDAKLRLDARGEAPRDEVAKMHAYRDGIAGAWGALGLAPSLHRGTWWAAPDGGGVGMFGWRPGVSPEAEEVQRRTVLERVEAFVRVARGMEAALGAAHDSTDAGAVAAPHPSRTFLV